MLNIKFLNCFSFAFRLEEEPKWQKKGIYWGYTAVPSSTHEFIRFMHKFGRRIRPIEKINPNLCCGEWVVGFFGPLEDGDYHFFIVDSLDIRWHRRGLGGPAEILSAAMFDRYRRIAGEPRYFAVSRI